MTRYVHGYQEREGRRLDDQAGALADLLHADTVFAPGSRVLELGCGVGSQTITLAARNPLAHIVSVDVSFDSLATAAERVADGRLSNVEFVRANLFALPFKPASFEYVFVCFVLEHLVDPLGALRIARLDADIWWPPDSYRGRPRLRLLPSRQRCRARRYCLPG